jgi:phage shock protein G
MCWNTRSNWWRISVNFSPKSSQIHHALRTVAGCFAVKSTDYFWHDSCNASKRFHIWESIMLELLFVIGFFVMLMVTGVSLLGIIAALIVATAFMFLGGMLALMIKLLPWLLLAVAVVWVIRAIKAPKVPKYQRYDRWRY